MAGSYTVGVEEEYQLVDAGDRSLRSSARAVLADDWGDELKKEFLETTVEIGTRVCEDSAAVADELSRLRFHTATAAAAHGLDIAAAGLHPFSRWEGHRVTEDDRYHAIAHLYGRLARDEHKFGMHIHVAVEAGIDRVRLMNAVRFYAPHIVALSASSPYFEGSDTQYASYRTVLWRRWPNAGIPPRFRDQREYDDYIAMLLSAGVITDEGNLYWSLRPHSKYPTLELRMPDVCPRLGDAVTIAALARVLVAAAEQGVLEEQPWPSLSDDLAHSLLSGNEWRAARGGLDGRIVDPARGSERVSDAIRRLIDRIAPVAEQIGESDLAAGVDDILERGSGAARMRRVSEDVGMRELVSWVVGETLLGTGLDRRDHQRYVLS